MSLQLEYAFVPTPNPIRASVPGTNPNTIDLLVALNPPGAFAVTLTEISIAIPVGDDTVPGNLSGASSLPQPIQVSGAAGWSISVSGGTITLLGSESGTAISGLISFVLPQVSVNEVSGTVPITISELPVTGGKVLDGTTYSLFKQAADFPISNFWASPASLSNLDETVTLYWTCTGQGQADVFSVYADGWNPAPCLTGGTCLTCADGAAGITTQPLSRTTTFTLDVIGTDGTDRVLLDSLQLTVPVLVPSISQNSYVKQYPVAGGRFASVHWLAYNAAYCSVLVGADVVVDNAPADTYVDGCLIYLGDTGTYQVSVVAHAAQGDAIATLQLGSWAVTAGQQVSTSLTPTGMAASPGAAQAVLACTDGSMLPTSKSYIALLELPGGTTAASYSTIAPGPVALSTDGDMAAVLLPRLADLVWVCVPNGDLNPTGVGPATFASMAFAPASYLLLVGGDDGTLGAMQPGESAPEASVPVGGIPAAVAAAAPMGGPVVALASVPSVNQVVFVNVDTFQLQGSPISVSKPGAIAASPDGTLALVALPGAGAVGVIDVASQTLEAATIPVGGAPSAIAFSPDGALAFVADPQHSAVTAIQVSTRTPLGTPLSLPGQPVAMAIGGAESTLMVACSNNTLVLY